MIYWFTGQPGHGKTTLAKMLKEYLENKEFRKNVFHVDGDDMRELLMNKDYSRKGREQNIKTAQQISLYLQNKGFDVVVSLVSPYREIREDLKRLTDVTEIYVTTSEKRGRENYHVSEYETPLDNFIEIDTTEKSELGSLRELIEKLKL